ncbi:MAG: ATP-grasp domain-containing protein [Candidatus Nanopelagicales bacterium]|nr:ATP-grasp domain-containing protein [Candidatus Nanopelagicales bacterium]
MSVTRREEQLDRVEKGLDGRTLAWFGIRGSDASSLLGLPSFRDSFAVAAPIGASRLDSDVTLEEMTGVRLDLDSHEIDEDGSDAAAELRRLLMGRLNRRSALVNYRPYHFTSNIGFALRDRTLALGMFKDRQSAFEYKPWVETELEREGVQTIPWRYVADEFRHDAIRYLDAGPVVLRVSRSSGGAGVYLVKDADELERTWPGGSDHLVAVGPFIEDALPINIGAVVFSPELVALHPASIQLIGLPDCTTRPFGYCGNDFRAFAALDESVVAAVESSTLQVGRWLGSHGYRGAFGVDFLLKEGILYFAEVNPRLQGSTAVAAAMATRAGEPDLLLDHLASLLGIPPSRCMSLSDWNTSLDLQAQIVVHNNLALKVSRRPSSALLSPALAGFDLQLLTSPEVAVDPGAIVARLVTDERVTATGFDSTPAAKAAVAVLLSAYRAVDAPKLGD